MMTRNEEARLLLDFVGARVREEAEQESDPKERRLLWQRWRYNSRKACDWVDMGAGGELLLIPGMLNDFDEMWKLAGWWSDHPDYPTKEVRA